MEGAIPPRNGEAGPCEAWWAGLREDAPRHPHRRDPGTASRALLDDEIPVGVGADAPSGRHDDGRAVFLDDRRTGDGLTEGEFGPPVKRALDPTGLPPIGVARCEGLCRRPLGRNGRERRAVLLADRLDAE